MATVVALQSFVGRLSKDKVDPKVREDGRPRVEKHSAFAEPSVFPGKVLEPGEKIEVQKGQHFDAAHRVVRAFPAMFGQVPLHQVEPAVEQATAGPGEKRGR